MSSESAGPDRAQDPDESPRDPDGGVTPPRRTDAAEETARDPDEADINPTGEKDPGDNPPLPREWN